MTDRQTRQTIPAAASSAESALAAKLERDRLRRLESERTRALVQSWIDSRDSFHTLCRWLVRGDEKAQRKLALVMLMAEYSTGRAA
jgi:hypothetical protein